MSDPENQDSGRPIVTASRAKDRRRLVAAAAVAALIVILGGGIALTARKSTDLPAPPRVTSDAGGQAVQLARDRQEIGPGMSASAAIAHVLAGLGDPQVTSAHLLNNPADVSGALRLMIRIDSDQGGAQRPVWVGELVQGAVSDLMRTDEATTSQVLPGSRVVDRNAKGHRVVTRLGYGAVVGGQQFESPSDADLRDRLSQVAARFGLTLRSVQILHPLDSAVSVTFTVPEGAVPWKSYQLTNAVNGSPQDIEGYFIELDSPTGEPLLQTQGASRIPAEASGSPRARTTASGPSTDRAGPVNADATPRVRAGRRATHGKHRGVTLARCAKTTLTNASAGPDRQRRASTATS